jgi:hypothetical protein
MNNTISIKSYLYVNDDVSGHTTIYLKGTFNNSNAWKGTITKINSSDYTMDEKINLISSSNEGCSHHIINSMFWKIYIEILTDEESCEDVINHDDSFVEWTSSMSYTNLNIPSNIWCYFVGQLTIEL